MLLGFCSVIDHRLRCQDAPVRIKSGNELVGDFVTDFRTSFSIDILDCDLVVLLNSCRTAWNEAVL